MPGCTAVLTSRSAPPKPFQPQLFSPPPRKHSQDIPLPTGHFLMNGPFPFPQRPRQFFPSSRNKNHIGDELRRLMDPTRWPVSILFHLSTSPIHTSLHLLPDTCERQRVCCPVPVLLKQRLSP